METVNLENENRQAVNIVFVYSLWLQGLHPLTFSFSSDHSAYTEIDAANTHMHLVFLFVSSHSVD